MGGLSSTHTMWRDRMQRTVWRVGLPITSAESVAMVVDDNCTDRFLGSLVYSRLTLAILLL